MNFKKIGAAVLAAAMTFGAALASVTAYAESEESAIVTENGYSYRPYKNDGKGVEGVEIVQYEGSEKTLIIPNELGGKKVLSIADEAFYKCNTLISVETPEGLVYLGHGAFSDCANLETAVIGEGPTELWGGTFWNCSKLKSLSVPVSTELIWFFLFGDNNGHTIENLYYAGTQEQWLAIQHEDEALKNGELCTINYKDDDSEATTSSDAEETEAETEAETSPAPEETEAAAPTQTDANPDKSNPDTGAAASIVPVVLILAAGGAVIASKKRK